MWKTGCICRFPDDSDIHILIIGNNDFIASIWKQKGIEFLFKYLKIAKYNLLLIV